MLDIALPEQFDRLLFTVLVGLVIGPLWLLAVQIGGRRLWRTALEVTLELLIVLVTVLALAVGTSLSLRAWVLLGLFGGVLVSVTLLRGIHPPWQEFRRQRRN